MSRRNFGLGHRDMARAGHIALETRSRLSFASIATISERWGEFCRWAKPKGVNKMEKITRDILLDYGRELAGQVGAGTLKASTAQNYVSAANRVLELARGDRSVRVSPTRDCLIPKRTGIATTSRALAPADHQALRGQLPERIAALLDLQRQFGLRFKESALLDARKALRQAETLGAVHIVDGTKGGRARTVPLAQPQEQLAALRQAAALQQGRSMVPHDQTYIRFAKACYREHSGFHDARHAYAQARYEALVKAPCPLAAGLPHGRAHHRYLAERLGLSLRQAQALDRKHRLVLSKELGHGRREITHAYLG
jgi:hypothetical protein